MCKWTLLCYEWGATATAALFVQLQPTQRYVSVTPSTEIVEITRLHLSDSTCLVHVNA